jgi:hypothetical protein
MSSEYASPARTETSLTVPSRADNNNERFLDSARNERALPQTARPTALKTQLKRGAEVQPSGICHGAR